MERLKLDVCLTPKLIEGFNLENTSVVIIDIVRASSTICTALHHGLDHLVTGDDVETIRNLKSEGYLIAGEREGLQLDGFDFGNSPISFMSRKELEGKKLAMTTTNGTYTIHLIKEAAKKFSDVEILIGAYVNYSKLKAYLLSANKNVLLLCSGWKGNPSIEDTIFAGKLAKDLEQSDRFRFTTDAASHAVLINERAGANLFDFVMDYSLRFKEKVGLLGQDIRYCVKQDVAQVLPILQDDKFIDKT